MDLCSLLDFYCSVRAILPPLFYPTLSVTRTKEFCRNLELFKSWKKPGFFHKWLYRVEKTNTSIHCRSHKTSESAAVSSLHESTITPTDSIWNTINVKVHCNTDTRVCRHPCTCGTKNIIHIILKEGLVTMETHHLRYYETRSWGWHVHMVRVQQRGRTDALMKGLSIANP